MIISRSETKTREKDDIFKLPSLKNKYALKKIRASPTPEAAWNKKFRRSNLKDEPSDYLLDY